MESDTYRNFSIFDEGKHLIPGNAFQKKAGKAPAKEFEKVMLIMGDFLHEKANNNLATLYEIPDQRYGKKGSHKREKREQEFEAFKPDIWLEDARKALIFKLRRCCFKMRDQ